MKVKSLFLNLKNLVKNNINLKSTFSRLMLSYIMLASIILCLSTLIPYVNYKNKVMLQINDMSEKLLVQSNYFADYIISWTAASGQRLYMDTDVFNLMYGKDLSSKDEAVGKRKLNLSLQTIPLAHSIYVYNGATGIFYSTLSDPTHIYDFYDMEVVNLLKNRKDNAASKLIPRKIFFSVDGLKGLSYKGNILTMVVSDYPLENSLEDGALILNLDARKVHNIFKNIAPEHSEIYIIDKEGTIVSHSDESMFTKNISDQRHIKNILSSGQNKGFLIDKIDGIASLATYVRSEKLNLTFVSIIPYSSLLKDIDSINRLTLILSITLLIVGIALSYLFSSKIYFPIRKIVTNVQQYFSRQRNGNIVKSEKINELEYLSHMLDRVLNDSTTLEKLSQADINFLKQQLLKGLLLNHSIEIKDLDSKFRQLNIDIPPEELGVYVLRLDAYKEFCASNSKESGDLIRFAICNIASELTSKHFTCEAVDMGGDHVAVLFNSQDRNCTRVVDILKPVIEEIQKTVSHYLEVSMTAGIGSMVDTPANISLSYNDAYNCTQYRFKYGPGLVLYNDIIVQDVNDDYRYPEEKEKCVFNALKLGHINEVKAALDEMLNEIRQYSYEDMLLAIIQLAANCKKLLKAIYDMDNANLYMDIGNFRRNLDKFESMETLKLWFLDVFTRIVQNRDEKKLNRREELVNKAIKYITENFSNPLLTPELTADFVSISPNYLRTVFKEVTGDSISSFINEYRLKKARELLETSEMPISEISGLIGFANDTYFYTAYKKLFGVTPSQHRKLQSNNLRQ